MYDMFSTHIRVHLDTIKELRKRRIEPNESDGDVIRRLMGLDPYGTRSGVSREVVAKRRNKEKLLVGQSSSEQEITPRQDEE